MFCRATVRWELSEILGAPVFIPSSILGVCAVLRHFPYPSDACDNAKIISTFVALPRNYMENFAVADLKNDYTQT